MTDVRNHVASMTVHRLARSIGYGTLTITDGGGTRHYGHGHPTAAVTVHEADTYRRLLRGGSVAFGDTYAEGAWDADDLTTLVRILSRNFRGLSALSDRLGATSARWGDWLRRRQGASPQRDRANIRHHYDLSNRFFELMLDETMMYSSAVFPDPAATLTEASTAKLERICRKLSLGPDDHVVEIGTGWGGFALHAARTRGCRVTTTTISEAQFAHASKRVSEAGLADRITVLDQDYRDLTGTYDKLVSIEMIEAVDWRQHDTFFATCDRLLGEEGLMALQAITIDDRSYPRAKNGHDFITETIFPGGCIPSIEAIARSVSHASTMRIVDLEDIGRHYAETLRRWRLAIEANRSQVESLDLGERFHRVWDLYLCYCEAAFLERHISDVQLVLAKPDWNAPLSVRAV